MPEQSNVDTNRAEQGGTQESLEESRIEPILSAEEYVVLRVMKLEKKLAKKDKDLEKAMKMLIVQREALNAMGLRLSTGGDYISAANYPNIDESGAKAIIEAGVLSDADMARIRSRQPQNGQ